MRILCLFLAASTPAFGIAFIQAQWNGFFEGIDSNHVQTFSFNTGNMLPQKYDSPNVGGSQTETLSSCFVAGVANCHLTGTGESAGHLTLNGGLMTGIASGGGLVVTNDGYPLASAFTSTGGSVTMIGRMSDTITTIGGTPGSPVQLGLFYNLHSIVGNTNRGSAQAILQISLGSTSIQVFNEILNGVADNSGAQAGGFPVTTFIGQALTLSVFFQIHAASTFSPAINGITEASASVDARNTADFYIQVLTPGAGYTTESGFVYNAASSVPEPSSVVLFTGALLAIWVRKNRRHTL